MTRSSGDKLTEATRKEYSVRTVHSVYPWIGGTTFAKRVRAERIPTINKPNRSIGSSKKNLGLGTGNAYKLTFAALVHVGVDDELHACGVREDIGSFYYDFIPKEDDREYETERPSGGGLAELLYFYTHYWYDVVLTIDVEHERRLGSDDVIVRNRRFNRVHHILVHTQGEQLSLGCETIRGSFTPDGHGVTVFSSVRISVDRIYNYVIKRLGVEAPLDMARVIADNNSG